jgi:hypothetical protein
MDPFTIRASSYEDVHADVQSIVLPPLFPRGLNVSLLQSLNKSLALVHRVRLEPGELQKGPFGPQPGPGMRSYVLGAVLTNATKSPWLGEGKHRLSLFFDPERLFGRALLVSDVFGDGRLRLNGRMDSSANYLRYGTLAPADDAKKSGGSSLIPPVMALSATLRGEDFVSVGRVSRISGLECAFSYNQRLFPGSPWTVGGETLLNVPALVGASKKRPLEWALGAARDSGNQHKSAVHIASTGSFSSVLSLHHVFHASDRSSIAAKFMLSPKSTDSMFAVGYRMRLQGTNSTVNGMVDSYGTVKVVVDREAMKDVRLGASVEARLGPGASRDGPEGAATFGLNISVGAPLLQPAPLSPITMNRDVFGPA